MGKFKNKELKCEKCGDTTVHRVLQKDIHTGKAQLRCLTCGTVRDHESMPRAKKTKAATAAPEGKQTVPA